MRKLDYREKKTRIYSKLRGVNSAFGNASGYSQGCLSKH
jgi:hypothetical protein